MSTPDAPSFIAHPLTLRYRKIATQLIEQINAVSRSYLDQMAALHTEGIISAEAATAAWNEFIAVHASFVVGPVLVADQDHAADITQVLLDVLAHHLAQIAADRKLSITLEWKIEKLPSIVLPN